MSFLQFLGYFMASMFLYRLVMFGISMVLQKWMLYKLERDIKSGKIQFMTPDQVMGTGSNDDGGQTWQ